MMTGTANLRRIACCLFLILPCIATQAGELPRVFLLDGKALAENKQRVLRGDALLKPALKALVRDADKQLKRGPWSVTDKTATPPSGDKHDYMSVGPYWWPDPGKPDGLPYIRKDGKVNPERNKIGDADRYQDMRNAVVTLSYAWYFTGEEKYAARAAMLIRAWYLDPATRMNPNMNYAQAIPGRTEGRGIGIVDAHGQPKIIDAVGLLQGSKAWTDNDQKALVKWCGALLDWLLTSNNGRDEAKTKNNHATQYDVQVASYALFVGKKEVAKQVLSAVPHRRIATQIKPDGSQPHELKRTRSWDYCAFNTLNFTRLARLGEHVGVDLWQREKDGPTITGAIDYLLPYALGEKKWERKQIRSFDGTRLLRPLLIAMKHDKSGRYAQAAKQLLSNNSIERMLYPIP